MKKEIETLNRGQEEIKNTISEINNIVETIKVGSMKQWIRSANWKPR